MLLVHRRNDPSCGVWAIPGGNVHLGETLQQAAEREIREETGITIQAKEPIYTFEMIERDESDRIRYHYVIIDLMATYLRGQVTAGDDALSAKWFAAEELADIPVSEVTRRLLDEQFGFGSATTPLPKKTMPPKE